MSNPNNPKSSFKETTAEELARAAAAAKQQAPTKDLDQTTVKALEHRSAAEVAANPPKTEDAGGMKDLPQARVKQLEHHSVEEVPEGKAKAGFGAPKAGTPPPDPKAAKPAPMVVSARVWAGGSIQVGDKIYGPNSLVDVPADQLDALIADGVVIDPKLDPKAVARQNPHLDPTLDANLLPKLDSSGNPLHHDPYGDPRVDADGNPTRDRR
jgi:hypothetical protein